MKRVFLGLLLFGAALSSFAGPLKIGWGSRNIWDGKCRTIITGQMHARWNQDPVVDPLTATALVIDNGADCVIFLSIDVTCIQENFLNPLLKELASVAPEVPQNKMIINATHTHSTGNFNREPTPECFKDLNISPDAFADYATKQIALAVKDAWNNRKPGLIGYGYGYAVVGHQRRAVYFYDRAEVAKQNNGDLGNIVTDGFAKMYGPTNEPGFSHHETGADATVNFLFTFDPDKKLTGAIINVPCPSQCSENLWALSADYWHDVRVALRAKYGENLQILPQCAAAGDISPHLRSYTEAAKRKWRLKYGTAVDAYTEEHNRKDIAERVAAAFDEVYSWAQKETFADLPVENRRVQLELERFKPSEAEYQNARYLLNKMPEPIDLSKITNPNALSKAQRTNTMYKRAKNVIERYEHFDPKDTFKTYTQIVRIGNVAFASNGFEPYIDFMHRIQARSPFEQVFIVQLAAPGHGSYIATDRAMQSRGYSGVAASCDVSPKGGQQLVEATLDTLKQMKEKK